jgi:hypothetical protein
MTNVEDYNLDRNTYKKLLRAKQHRHRTQLLQSMYLCMFVCVLHAFLFEKQRTIFEIEGYNLHQR